MEVELPKPVAWTLAWVVLVMACATIGYAVSPRTADGRPVLLSPDVRAVETYRRSVVSWVREWQALAEALRVILDSEGELLSTSQKTQQAFAKSVELSAAVDSSDTPASLVGLRDQTAATAEAFVKASLAAARWISAPSAEKRTAAETELETAERSLITLEANEWIRDSK